jgi:hypothetical protein
MEADISIWRKTGHFYFALTEQCLSASRLFALVVQGIKSRLVCDQGI